METLWNSDSREFYQIYQVISKYFNGNSDNFVPWTFLQYFFNERGNMWTIGETGQLAEFMENSRYFQDLPSQGTQAMLTQDTKKVWTLQPKPSQAKPSPAWGAAWGAVQARCSSAALPSDYITTPVALVQHCSGRGAAAAAGRLRSISLVCVLHKTISWRNKWKYYLKDH